MLDQLKRVDPMHGWVLLAVVILLLFVFEVGRWLARRREGVDANTKFHAANVLNGMLTLLSFFLAFSFSIASEHFENRRRIVLDEANAIGTTYLRSKYLPPAHADKIQRLLLEYANLRITPADPSTIPRLRERSGKIQTQLWDQAIALESVNPNSEFAGLFIVSLNEMIDLDEARITTTVVYRLPIIIMIVLFGIAILTLMVMGYSAGLRDARSAVLTFAVVLAVSGVLVLIIDLDRPVQRAFSVDQQPLIDVRDSLEKDLRQ
ncbi:DUF4239 domain-containing protein [Bradymonas sediminis]|uniref:Uncharacterized protein n=1 Tax=Bradymonas sediminis TaxID=1548548 RepID=A0A2Z4FGZ9_9DELT|nr:DUF4239 domain-containing protein [Bradymonas sediminis]AWV88034.1 hypothetical protein DN745_01275 [Bradymonas sediminis]TDP77157.1 uncharacterized protein DUF4239 [Bradymonas sediminis]